MAGARRTAHLTRRTACFARHASVAQAFKAARCARECRLCTVGVWTSTRLALVRTREHPEVRRCVVSKRPAEHNTRAKDRKISPFPIYMHARTAVDVAA
jgi:hypothetical protein